MNLNDLRAPFPPNEIEWRVGSTSGDKTKGLALAYLTARHVMERLDEVCGPQNWQDRYEFHGSRTVCYLSIRIGEEWVTKADGAGDSDVEAEKGAISDALKRAAVKWGIGRYLYQTGNTWVQIEPAGKSFRIKETEYARLESALARQFGGAPAPAAPASAPTTQPANDGRYGELREILKTAAAGGMDGLANAWKLHFAEIKRLPDARQQELAVLKDDLKTAIQQARNLAA